MARKRTRKPKLPQMFDGSAELIAVVNDEFEILYANESCCQWLDIASEALGGKKLSFSSQNMDDSITAKANGICPPPELFESTEHCSSGFVYKTEANSRLWKQAWFARLKDTETDSTSILVVAVGPDLSAPNSDDYAIVGIRHNILAQLQLVSNENFSRASLIGSSDYSKRLRRQVKAVAGNQSDCLIIGPPGSGREHLARTIFHQREIEDASLVPIHCAIADSQLIQHSIKEWVFEQRDSQTQDWLLLLEVDQLSSEAQAELAAYTQLPNFELRILATSQRELVELSQQTLFSAKLASHMSVQIIKTTSLANRKEDIPLMAQHFIEEQNKNSNKQVSRLSVEVTELFYEYHWPGNIDELKQMIVDAFGNCASTVIQPADLPAAFNHGISAARIGYREVPKIQLNEYLADIETDLINRALQQTQNNKTKAADLLGINRAKLIRRCAALGISKPDQDSTPPDVVDESAFKEAD